MDIILNFLKYVSEISSPCLPHCQQRPIRSSHEGMVDLSSFYCFTWKGEPPALRGATGVDVGNSFSGMKVWGRRRQEGSLWVAAAKPLPRSTILDACLMHLASCLANVLSSLAWYSCSPSGEGTSSHEAHILVKLTNGLKNLTMFC